MKSKAILTMDEQWRIVRQICTPFGINYEKLKDDAYRGDGVAITEKNLILISERQRTEDQIISLVLHEVMHCLAAKTKKYNVFHNGPFGGEWKVQDLLIYRKTALFAELYVDIQAEKAAKKLFPHIRYNRYYRTKRDKAFLRRYTSKFVKEVKEALDAEDMA